MTYFRRMLRLGLLGNSQGAPIPVNTVQPVVSGTATEGEQLSCTTGTWTNSPTSYAYQWYTVLLDESNNAILDEVYGEPIPDAEIVGATSSTYTIDGAYVGERLTCGVIATNAQGDSVEHFADATGIVAASAGPATLTYQSYAIDLTGLTTYSFASVGIGSADSTRRVIVAVHWGNSAARTLSSATIGGVSATIHVQSSSTARGVAIISALVPTGTTATIEFTFSGAAVRAGIGVWTSIDEQNSSPTATFTDATDPFSGTINVPADGFVVAAFSVFENSGAGTVSWTGPTEVYDNVASVGSTMGLSGASASGLSANASYTVSVVANAGPSLPVEEGHLVAVSWA